MSRRQKVVLVTVLVLVVGLFAIAVGGQGGTGDGHLTGGQGGLVGWLGDHVGGQNAVADGDLVAGCPVAQDQLAVPGTCRLTVKKNAARLRTLHLRALNEITVTAPAPQQDFTVTDSVKANEDLKVAVGAGGADITVVCRAAPNCAVVLVRGR